MTRARRNGLAATGALAGIFSICPARADINTSVALDIGVRGELFGGDLDSGFRLENSRVSATSGRFSGGSVRGEFGSIGHSEFDLSLSRRGFNGLNTSFGNGSLTTTLFGGSVTGRGLSGKRDSAPLVGARATWALHKKLRLSASALTTPRVNDENGGFVGAISLGYQPRPATQLGVEAARSGNGMGLQLVATHRERMLTARAIVRRVDAQFSTAANPDLQARRNGYLLDGSVRRGNFLLALGTRRLSGGREGRDFFDRATLSFRKRGAPSVALYFGRGERLLRPFLFQLGEDEDEEEVALLLTQTQNFGLQVAQRFGSMQTSLNFDRNTSRIVGTPDSEQKSDRLSLSLARPLGQFNVNLLASQVLSSRSESNARQVGSVAQLFVSRDWSRGTRARVGLGREEVRSGSRTATRLIGDLQLQLPLARHTGVSLFYRALLSGAGVGQVDDRFRIRFRRLLNFGPQRAANARTKEQRRVLGRIEGRVFDDLNLNGLFDAGEPPLPGVTVSLRGNLDTQSKPDGAWAFADLSPRVYTVRIETKTLPLEMSVLGASEVPVTLGAKQSATVDFPAVRAGTIRGVVFEDTNRNGARDEGEKPVADALVRVEGSPVISFSDARGEWTLANLPPREWKIEVDVVYLGGDYSATTPAPLEINVPPGGEVRDVLLGIAPAPREVVPSFFGDNSE